MQIARFQLMAMIDAKLYSHLVFQNSFRNIEKQKSYRNCLGDWLELWPSIFLPAIYMDTGFDWTLVDTKTECFQSE